MYKNPYSPKIEVVPETKTVKLLKSILANNYRTKIEKVRSNYEKKLKDIENKYTNDVEQISNNYKITIHNIKSIHSDDIKKLNDEIKNISTEKKELKSNHNKELNKYKLKILCHIKNDIILRKKLSRQQKIISTILYIDFMFIFPTFWYFLL